jgi:hypothetical protein
MNTLVTANQKDGAGKTSKLVPLAFDFAERGYENRHPQSRHKSKGFSHYSDNKIESN